MSKHAGRELRALKPLPNGRSQKAGELPRAKRNSSTPAAATPKPKKKKQAVDDDTLTIGLSRASDVEEIDKENTDPELNVPAENPSDDAPTTSAAEKNTAPKTPNVQAENLSDDAPTTSAAVEKKSNEMCPACGKPWGSGRSFIGCDGCHAWCHFSCFKLYKLHTKVIDKFYCPPCIVHKECELKFYEEVPKELGCVENIEDRNVIFEALKLSVDVKMKDAVASFSSKEADKQ